MKLLIGLVFITIVGSLFAAGYFMMRSGGDKQGKKTRMADALAWRIGLSVALFIGVLTAYALGWISPTGIVMGS
jgi:hypothetical protein